VYKRSYQKYLDASLKLSRQSKRHFTRTERSALSRKYFIHRAYQPRQLIVSCLSAPNDGLKSESLTAASNLVDVRCKSSYLLKRMAQGEHVQRRGREAIRIAHFVSPRVLLQVILASESFAADDAGVRPDASVNPLVSRQFLVPRKRLAAGFDVALERSLACNNANERYIPVTFQFGRLAIWFICATSIYQRLRINFALIYL